MCGTCTKTTASTPCPANVPRRGAGGEPRPEFLSEISCRLSSFLPQLSRCRALCNEPSRPLRRLTPLLLPSARRRPPAGYLTPTPPRCRGVGVVLTPGSNHGRETLINLAAAEAWRACRGVGPAGAAGW